MLRSLLIVVVALGVSVSVAWAKPKVALMPIEGDPSGNISDQVLDALDDSAIVAISMKAVSRAADKLGYDSDLSVKQARKLGKALEVDAVVSASYSRDGKRKVLKFKLVVGGKKARGFKVTFNNAKSRNFKTQLRDKLVERIVGAAGDRDDDDDDDEPVLAKKPKKAKKGKDKGKNKGKNKGKPTEDDDDDKPGPKQVADADDGDDEDGDEDGDDDDGTEPDGDEADDIDAAVRRVSPHSANRVAARLDLGGSFQNRSLVFTKRADFPEGPNNFRVKPVPGMRFAAELYPLAFKDPKSMLAGLGLAGSFDQTLALTLRTTAEANTPVKATQLSWSIGARYRLALGSTATSPTVTVGGGIARRRFKTNRQVLMDPASLDVPDTYYKMFDPGLSVRIPLLKVVALTFGGQALLITDAGEIQKPYSYGKAKVFGGAAQAGIDVVLGNRFAIRVVGEFVQVGFSFTGGGQLSNARDLDPSTKDVGGAADRSVGGAATLAVLY